MAKKVCYHVPLDKLGDSHRLCWHRFCDGVPTFVSSYEFAAVQAGVYYSIFHKGEGCFGSFAEEYLYDIGCRIITREDCGNQGYYEYGVTGVSDMVYHYDLAALLNRNIYGYQDIANGRGHHLHTALGAREYEVLKNLEEVSEVGGGEYKVLGSDGHSFTFKIDAHGLMKITG